MVQKFRISLFGAVSLFAAMPMLQVWADTSNTGRSVPGLRGRIGSPAKQAAPSVVPSATLPTASPRANAAPANVFASSGVMTFAPSSGSSGSASQGRKTDERKPVGLRGRLESGTQEVVVETGVPISGDAGASSVNYARIRLAHEQDLSDNWSARIGLRAEINNQTGDQSFTDLDLILDETFVRYRAGDTRLTMGWQKVIWGSLDLDPSTDLLSRLDLTRPLEFTARERRLAFPAIRLEQFWGDYKADLLWQPWYEGARLPEEQSIWAPIDPVSGQLIGGQSSSLTNYLIQNFGISDEDIGSGGFGLRLSRAGQGLDNAITVQRSRPSLPYPELAPVLADALANNTNLFVALQDLQGPAFSGIHPETWSFGTDGSVSEGPRIWRADVNYLTDVPYTDSNFRVQTSPEIRAGVGVDYYPGDGDLHLLLELSGRQRLESTDAQDQSSVLTLAGQLEQEFGRGDWRAGVNFRAALNSNDLYINPEISYTGFTNHIISFGYYQLDGSAETAGGFYDNNDMVALRWRLKN